MTDDEYEELPVLNPADAERNIQDISNRLAKGVVAVSKAEHEAKAKRRLFDLAYAHAYKRASGEPAHERRYSADIATMAQREEAEVAELAFKYAERYAKALEKQLMAWQSISSSLRAMYGAAGAGQR